ncbi:MAG: transposase [Gammaproteobacteria bacterium]|nr:transposase [Gammaproteobacteria bacterium]
MLIKSDTKVDATSIAKLLQEALGEQELKRIARRCGFQKRERKITALELLIACISTLGSGDAQWISDILRTFNKLTGKNVQYKPFYNQLAKKEFPEFLMLVLEQIVMKLTICTIDCELLGKLNLFDDIIIHDGTSFALKDVLARHWPGRFTAVSPAAVELHVTMSVVENAPIGIMLAPDKDTERPYAPEASELAHQLLLADRGYQSKDYMKQLQSADGCYIIRAPAILDPSS